MSSEGISMREAFMREAIRLAAEGVRRGDGGPFGAVVVRAGEIVGRGWNRVVADNDPTAHAEINAIRDACRRLGDFRLTGCELYSACEPCPMCLAAAYWARLEQVWYGATAQDAAAIGFDDSHIQRQVKQPEERRLLSHGQLLRGEALVVFRLWRESGSRVDY
jgi:tRNA(Arg) A34 adenosine deaminase TadA